MGKVFVKDGTPVGSRSLCASCSNAHTVTGFRESEQIVVCTEVHPNLTLSFAVHTCTNYHDKNRPTWEQMQKLAIEVNLGTLKPVGFKTGAGFGQDVVVQEGDE